jgi:hypothetical protein
VLFPWQVNISKIISGGQTGADRGGLDAAIHCGLDYGGSIPRGRKAEDGAVPLAYDTLVELSSTNYLARTEANVLAADATLVLAHGPPAGGSLHTVALAGAHGRPCLVVDLDAGQQENLARIVHWLAGAGPGTGGILNVAGPRESQQPGIAAEVKACLVDLLPQVNG